MTQEQAYQEYLEKATVAGEAICLRCGACCGALDDDPCSRLVASDGKYFCSVYENRLGLQKTAKGREFRCVPLRNILFESWAGSWKCAYKKSQVTI